MPGQDDLQLVEWRAYPASDVDAVLGGLTTALAATRAELDETRAALETARADADAAIAQARNPAPSVLSGEAATLLERAVVLVQMTAEILGALTQIGRPVESATNGAFVADREAPPEEPDAAAGTPAPIDAPRAGRDDLPTAHPDDESADSLASDQVDSGALLAPQVDYEGVLDDARRRIDVIRAAIATEDAGTKNGLRISAPRSAAAAVQKGWQPAASDRHNADPAEHADREPPAPRSETSLSTGSPVGPFGNGSSPPPEPGRAPILGSRRTVTWRRMRDPFLLSGLILGAMVLSGGRFGRRHI